MAVSVGAAAMLRGSALSVLVMTASLVLVATAFLLRHEEEQARTGALLYVAAVSLSLSDSASAFGGAADAVAEVTAWWALPPLAAVLLTYPGRRVARRWHAWLLAAVTGEFLVAWTVARLLWPTDLPTGAWGIVVDGILFLAAPVLPALACVALVQRWRDAGPPERLAVRSVALVGLALCGTLALRLVAFPVAEWGGVVEVLHGTARVLNLVCLAVAPAGLLLEALRRRARQRAMVEDLLRAGSDPVRIRSSVAHALDDPSLRLGLAGGPAGQRFVDVTDPEATVPVDHPPPGRLVHVLPAADGTAIAAVELDAVAAGDPAQVRVVLAGAALALENVRLQTSLWTSLEEVRRSRARIVEAGVRSRQRLERDLHDGAQQQLLAVAATLARAQLLPAPHDRDRALAEARTQLSTALGELRRLARGIHPALLSEGGLAHALPSLAESSPVPVDVDVPEVLRSIRLPAPVESTLWFVAAEAVTNAVRHSAGGHVDVRLRVTDDAVRLSIEDDGRGGAEPTQGGGLAGLADRVAALGGDFRVESPPGAGTRVEVVVPCGW
ncbi:sensor histidine kinase [Geodermatophilus sp. SYSU D00742]